LFLAFTLCAFVIYRYRRPGCGETWVWRLVLTGYVLACAGAFLDYWTQWTGTYNVLFQVGWIVTLPGLLLTMVGSTVLGMTLLVRGSAPRLPALLLALAIPLAWLILQATSLGNAVLPEDDDPSDDDGDQKEDQEDQKQPLWPLTHYDHLWRRRGYLTHNESLSASVNRSSRGRSFVASRRAT
jgi:hypothetical protein